MGLQAVLLAGVLKVGVSQHFCQPSRGLTVGNEGLHPEP